MVSRFTTLMFLLTSILLVIIIQEIGAIEDHEYLLNTRKINPIKDDLFNENQMYKLHHQVTTILQRTKRQSEYNYRNRRYPYPIPILVGGGFGPKAFGTRGFGSRSFGARGFGARGFGARGFGGRGIGGLGRGIGGFGGRGRG